MDRSFIVAYQSSQEVVLYDGLNTEHVLLNEIMSKHHTKIQACVAYPSPHLV